MAGKKVRVFRVRRRRCVLDCGKRMALKVDRSRLLGEGVFANVYVGRDEVAGIDLAVK